MRQGCPISVRSAGTPDTCANADSRPRTCPLGPANVPTRGRKCADSRNRGPAR
jgi:hypothetical protein